MFDTHQAVTRWDRVKRLIDENQSLDRMNEDTKHPTIAREPVTIDVYGKKIKHNLPVRRPHPGAESPLPDSETVVTTQFYDYITQRAKWKMLSDNVLGVRQILLRTHGRTTVNNVPVLFSLNKNADTINQDRQNMSEDEAIRQTSIILMKEYLDGYRMEIDYKLSIKSNLTAQRMDFPIKKDYDFIIETSKNPVLNVHIPNNYTA